MNDLQILIGKIGLYCGYYGEYKFPPTDKIIGADLPHGHFKKLNPGDKLKIHWADYYDVGYIFTLPGFEGNDVWMAGIVHIPNPSNPGGKDNLEPVWITLNDLLENELIKRIERL